MANRDYIPSSEAEILEWLTRFKTWLLANGTSHGLSQQEVDDIVAAIDTAIAACAECDIREAAYHAGIQDKRHDLADALSAVRAVVKRLQADPTMTDGARADAGMTVPDSQPTPSSQQAVLELNVPQFILDWSKPHQITIRWGTNPGDERNNAKPPNILGVQIQYCRGGIPEQESAWLTLDIDTRSPYIFTVHDDTPTTYAIRMCWMDKKGNKGPYCLPSECTVTV